MKNHYLLLLVLFWQCKSASEPSQFSSYEKSDYVFRGSLEESNKANLSVLDDAEGLHLVRVNEVLLASAGHEHFKGGLITVAMDKSITTSPVKGSEYIFYTNTWLFGESLAVRANEIRSVEEKANMKNEVASFQKIRQDNLLTQRINSANLVVVGKVTEVSNVEKVSESKTRLRLSEHDPQWKLATVQIDDKVKGNVEGASVQFYFASSADVQWYNAPKFSQESEGVFILQQTDASLLPNGALVLTNALDFRAKSELNQIKKIMNKK